jgi:O-antigen/teichoic acid export membrane protein
MSVQLRGLMKDIATYSFGDIILRATTFFTTPIYTRIFTPADYGVWSYIATAVGLLSTLLILGCDSAYALYFFKAKSEEEKQQLTSTVLGFLALWSGGIILMTLPFATAFSRLSFNTSQYGILFFCALLTAPLTLLSSLCGQVLRNQFRARLFTQLNVITTLLTIGLSLFCAIVFKLGIAGLFIGALIGTAIMLPVRVWMVRSMLRPTFSWPALRKLLAYGVPLAPVGLAYWVFASSDRLVLGKLSTLEQLGLYSIANSMTSVLAFVHSAIGQAWSPHAIRIREEHPAVAPILFGQIMTYILVGFGLLCVGYTTFAREALVILASPAFYAAAPAVGPLAIGFVAYASTHISALGISLSGKTGYFTLYSWISALLNLILNIIFVPHWGMMAASWSTAISYVFITLAYVWTSQRLIRVEYETRRAIIASVLITLFTIAAPFLPNLNLFVNIGIKIIYCLVFVVFLFAFKVLDQREWQSAREFWSSAQMRLSRRTS